MRHFIPIVNRVSPLLTLALEGCRDLWSVITIIDNRDRQEETAVCLSDIAPGIHVYKPPVPLTTAQTMNLMLKFAIEQNHLFFTWQHLDAICIGDTARRLPEIARDYLLEEKRWGVLLTKSILEPPRCLDGKIYRYITTDAFAAYNTAALELIGGWDWIRFPYYVLDSDIYCRLSKFNFPIINTELEVNHATFSQTIRADSEREIVIESHWPLWRHLYSEKHKEPFWDYELFQ